MDCALGRFIDKATPVGPQRPRSLGTEGQHSNDRVVEPTHVGVAVKALTIVAVAILNQPESRELDAVLSLDGARDVAQRNMRQRSSSTPPRTETTFFDVLLVAKEFGRLPIDGAEQMVKEQVGTDEPAS